MARLKKIAVGLLIGFVALAALFVLVVGPWPVYRSTNYAEKAYFHEAMAAITAQAAANDYTAAPGRLHAGWARRPITPEVGTPLAGYSARGLTHHSTGVRDELYVTTLAFSDGKDTAVLVGADILITPPHIADAVREAVAARTPLTADDLLFNASHTHCGPGGLGRGLAMRVTAGQYVPEVTDLLTDAYTEAIVEAYEKLAPARIAGGRIDAPQFIRNRVRDAAVDADLSYAVVELESGDRCYLVSYSAHATIFGSSMMSFSAEYPGALRRYIEEQTGADAVFLGGAVGSMAPRTPEGPDAGARVEAMGQALARLVLEDSEALDFETHIDIAGVGVRTGMPALQIRPVSPNWRVSPILTRLMFRPFPTDGWIHGVRAGERFFVGLPCDFSGEISVEWKAWADARGIELWTLSFCGTYCGYFSPDEYYDVEPLNYETGLMNWFGPDTEAYFTDLFQHMLVSMTPEAPRAGG